MEYATDEQQLEAIRQWFKKHGKSLLTVILFAAAIVMAVRYWMHHKEVVLQEASEHYMALMMNQSQADIQSARAKSTLLMNDFSHTPYAAMAAFNLAKMALDEQQYDKAIEDLNWVIDNSDVQAFQLIARARAARILMNENKLDEALKLLSVQDADGYTSVIEELKGDIYLQKNDSEQAKRAYEAAMKSSKSSEVEQPLLRMKLQELGIQEEAKEDLS